MGRGRSRVGSGGGSGSVASSSAWSSEVDEMREQFSSLKDNQKAVFLYRENFLSQKDALAHMRAGDIDEQGELYFSILEENGNYNPTKRTLDNSNRSKELVDSGEFADHIAARKELLKREAGITGANADKTYAVMEKWFGGRWAEADTATLDKFVEKAPAYNGKIYRGLHFENAAELDAFVGGMGVGDRISMRGKNASWTNEESTARTFAHSVDDTYSSAIITCLHNTTSAPVQSYSGKGEQEVLSSSKAQWTVLRKDITVLPNGNKKVNIYVVEANNG